jgi:haloalkane dehalogenase
VDVAEGQIHLIESTTDTPGVLPLVMLHPTASSSEMLRPVIQLLAGEFKVFAPDTPGFGGSDPLEGAVTVSGMATVLVEALGVLGIDRCWLYGNHTGAVLAAWIAANHPGLVEKLMLSGPPRLSEERKAQLRGAVSPMTLSEDGSHLIKIWDRYRGFAVSSGLEVPHREFALHLAADRPEETFHSVILEDLDDIYRRIGCPTMITAGEKDSLRPGLDSVTELIEDSVIELIPDTGNFVVDEAPHRVAEQIREWFV